MAVSIGLLDVPVDILLLIFPYLDALSFLNLTASCKALHKPAFTDDAKYWSTLVRTTFRAPNQPVVQQDGERWRRLFKRLLTQSKVFTWGNSDKGCLGQGNIRDPLALVDGPPPRLLRTRNNSPQEMQNMEPLGVISDVQCGGWSTTLLTSKGALFAVGVIDGLQPHLRYPPYMQKPMPRPTPLRYPPGFPAPHDRYEPSTAVKQFSSGRCHVLALSDSGRIWSWQNIEHDAYNVRFMSHDVVEDRANGHGVVRKVVAGWNKSAALIERTGIVVWEPLFRGERDHGEGDTALVLETAIVPMTDFCRARNGELSTVTGREVSLSGNELVGEVLNFIVLEELIVFNTSVGKAFVARITWSLMPNTRSVSEPVELRFHGTNPGQEEDYFVVDIQGTFRSFAVFTRSGAVFTSTQDQIKNYLDGEIDGDMILRQIPALQHKDVIQVAFGDYHFHALHASGHITSYGTEPGICGALGLGGDHGRIGRLRGLDYPRLGSDGILTQPAYKEGRRIWFEREKRLWLQFLSLGGCDQAEAEDRLRMAVQAGENLCNVEVSEWIEQESRDWETKYGLQKEDDDHLGAYFALSVAAAGWHSGALVLVNEELAARLGHACEVPTQLCETSDDVVSEPAAISASLTTASSLLTAVRNTIADYGRRALGMPASNAFQALSANGMPDRRRSGPPRELVSPRPGFDYVWAQDHFPRLQLVNGTVMPGSVPLHTWRYGRPSWLAPSSSRIA